MECPKCGEGQLELTSTDDRIEWTVQFYTCNNCGANFEQKIIYQTQSRLVESDNLYDEKGKLM